MPFGAADESYPPVIPGGPPELGQVPGLGKIIAIAGGGYGGWALRADGTVMGWGVNGDGEIGDGTRVEHLTTPVRVKGLTQVTSLCQDNGLTGCALRRDGTEWIWGDNRAGELGDGTTRSRPAPRPIPLLKGVVGMAQGDVSGYALVRP
jgi:alpha-tubulin suppressor-like RCC1 family protein